MYIAYTADPDGDFPVKEILIYTTTHRHTFHTSLLHDIQEYEDHQQDD